MILRNYQRKCVTSCISALKKHGNTLLVSATGSGKTVMMSEVVNKIIGKNKRAMVVQHRDELTSQNSDTFSNIFPNKYISFYNANKKSWKGQVVFSMIQTLAKDKALADMPAMDLIVYDEAHHASSNSYRGLTARAKELNPNVKILGVTATPERSDKRGLMDTFDNVAENITIHELVQSGHLVPPRGFIVDIGTQKALGRVKKTVNDYNMAEVEAIQNSRVLNNKIVEHWKHEAVDRPTLVFCATIKHAEDVRDSFRDAGYTSEALSSNTPKKERREILRRFDQGEVQLLTNPMVLSEGYDSPICSCVILLRLSSHKSTMMQMIGRGLRKIDTNKYPGMTKKDCKVIDFGISLINHGDLNIDYKLRFDRNNKDVVSTKNCPSCSAKLPINTQVCAICGYEFKILPTVDDNSYCEMEEFRLVEIDLINNSPFKWISIFESNKVLITSGFGCWATVVTKDNENFFAIGCKGKEEPITLNISNKIGAISSADDWMRTYSTSACAKKAAKWMFEPISDKQQILLKNIGGGGNHIMSKVEGAANITFRLNLRKIEELIKI